MSLGEMKQVARSLSANERAELRAYLRVLDLAEDKAQQAKIFEKLAHARAGNTVDQDELGRLLGKRPAA